MKRRDFLKKSAGAGLAVATLPTLAGLEMQTLAQSPALDALQKLTADSDRILVLVQLAGGNDGLNTLVPVANQLYHDARPNLSLKEEDTLPLNDGLRWHSALGGLRNLYEDEKLAIVQGVTYPNPNRSHFRGTDIWLTASDANIFLGSGWLGRYLSTKFPSFPESLPDAPMAIQIRGALSLGFNSKSGSTAIKFDSAEEFVNLVEGDGGTQYPDAPDTPAGAELEFVRSIAESSQTYSTVIDDAHSKGSNSTKVSYPAGDLGLALSGVAKLISGGLKTRIYLVSLGGFDTHASQLGLHNALLQNVSDSVAAFVQDLNDQGLGDRVAGMTFSEFGRRVNQNGSSGTDHGTAAPLFVFGNKVLGKEIHGSDPDLENLDNRGDLVMEHDFRQIYASVLSQWFGEADTMLQQVLLDDFATIPLFEAPAPTSVQDRLLHDLNVRTYPNPVREHSTIEYTLPTRAVVQLSIVDIQGATLHRLVAQEQPAGTHRQPFHAGRLPAGVYFYRLQVGSHTALKQLQLIR